MNNYRKKSAVLCQDWAETFTVLRGQPNTHFIKGNIGVYVLNRNPNCQTNLAEGILLNGEIILRLF